jgi:hypothetical protein
MLKCHAISIKIASLEKKSLLTSDTIQYNMMFTALAKAL